MGAVFCAAIRTPITAIVIIFELTASFSLILPLMISVVIAYLVAEAIAPGSLYSRILDWKGLPSPTPLPPWRSLPPLTAAAVMQSPVEVLPHQMPLEDVFHFFRRTSHSGFPIFDGETLVGIVTEQDLAQLNPDTLCTGFSQLTLQDIMSPTPVTITPETPLPEILQRFRQQQCSHLPVMEDGQLVGIVTHTDIIRLATLAAANTG
jgi:CIC family chloride channel protein